MNQIAFFYAVIAFAMFASGPQVYAVTEPVPSPPCAEELDRPDIVVAHVTRLGGLKQNFRMLPWHFERVRKTHGLLISVIDVAIAVPFSFAPLFKIEKTIRPPALSQNFVGPHIKNAAAVIDRIVEEGQRIGLNITPSDEAVYLNSTMDLAPNGALAIQHTPLGSLVLNTALGNLEIYANLSAPLVKQILAPLAKELGLEEFVAEGDGRISVSMSDGEFDFEKATTNTAQKRLAVLRLPSGEQLSRPEMVEVEAYRPNDEIKERWNSNKPAGRRPIVSDRVRIQRFGWRNM